MHTSGDRSKLALTVLALLALATLVVKSFIEWKVTGVSEVIP